MLDSQTPQRLPGWKDASLNSKSGIFWDDQKNTSQPLADFFGLHFEILEEAYALPFGIQHVQGASMEGFEDDIIGGLLFRVSFDNCITTDRDLQIRLFIVNRDIRL